MGVEGFSYDMIVWILLGSFSWSKALRSSMMQHVNLRLRWILFWRIKPGLGSLQGLLTVTIVELKDDNKARWSATLVQPLAMSLELRQMWWNGGDFFGLTFLYHGCLYRLVGTWESKTIWQVEKIRSVGLY